MDKKACLIQTREYIKNELKPDPTGHDYIHCFRVERAALRIARSVHGDPFVTSMAALLHDLDDWKFNRHGEKEALKKAGAWMKKMGLARKAISQISGILKEVSFKGAGVKTFQGTPEGRAVQDADRLDALGAIGIARAFAYGGYKGRLMYDPQVLPVRHRSFAQYRKSGGHTIAHFYEKLFLLRGRMNTALGRKMAGERHEFVKQFLKRFMKEW